MEVSEKEVFSVLLDKAEQTAKEKKEKEQEDGRDSNREEDTDNRRTAV